MTEFYDDLVKACKKAASELRKYTTEINNKKSVRDMEYYYEKEFVALTYHYLLKAGYSPRYLSLENLWNQSLGGEKKRVRKHMDLSCTDENGDEEVVEVKPVYRFTSEEQLKKDYKKRILVDYRKLKTLNSTHINEKYIIVPFLGVEKEYLPNKYKKAVESIFSRGVNGIKLITC